MAAREPGTSGSPGEQPGIGQSATTPGQEVAPRCESPPFVTSYGIAHHGHGNSVTSNTLRRGSSDSAAAVETSHTSAPHNTPPRWQQQQQQQLQLGNANDGRFASMGAHGFNMDAWAPASHPHTPPARPSDASKPSANGREHDSVDCSSAAPVNAAAGSAPDDSQQCQEQPQQQNNGGLRNTAMLGAPHLQFQLPPQMRLLQFRNKSGGVKARDQQPADSPRISNSSS